MSGRHLGQLVFQKEKSEADKPEFLKSFEGSSQKLSNHRRRQPKVPVWPSELYHATMASLAQPALPPLPEMHASKVLTFLSVASAFSLRHLCFHHSFCQERLPLLPPVPALYTHAKL